MGTTSSRYEGGGHGYVTTTHEYHHSKGHRRHTCSLMSFELDGGHASSSFGSNSRRTNSSPRKRTRQHYQRRGASRFKSRTYAGPELERIVVDSTQEYQTKQQLQQKKDRNFNKYCCGICQASRMEWDKYKPSPAVKDYAAVSAQNSKFRQYMEDECVVIPKFQAFQGDPAKSCFFGIFDGHGGDFCSKFVAKHFDQIFQEKIDKWQRVKQKEAEINHSGSVSSGNSTVISTESELLENDLLLSPEEIAQCYIQAFAEMDTKLTEHEEAANAGTTAVTCLIRKYHGKTFYHVANVGDSRAILFLNGKTIRLSVDHKATTNKDEVKRIRDANGIVFNNRVGGFISVTRALGQADEKDFIISDPHIASGEVKKSEDAFLLLVSDGITDVFSDEESTEFVTQRFARGYKSITICKDLLDEAKAKGARDNMTVVLACLASQ